MYIQAEVRGQSSEVKIQRSRVSPHTQCVVSLVILALPHKEVAVSERPEQLFCLVSADVAMEPAGDIHVRTTTMKNISIKRIFSFTFATNDKNHEERTAKQQPHKNTLVTALHSNSS